MFTEITARGIAVASKTFGRFITFPVIFIMARQDRQTEPGYMHGKFFVIHKKLVLVHLLETQPIFQLYQT